jgi:hypothetical protein
LQDTFGLDHSYETRDSNVPEKRFDSHVVGVSFGLDWWKR